MVLLYMLGHTFGILSHKVAYMTYFFTCTSIFVIPSYIIFGKYSVTMWALKCSLPIAQFSVTLKIFYKLKSFSCKWTFWALFLIFTIDFMGCELTVSTKMFIAHKAGLFVLRIMTISTTVISVCTFIILCFLKGKHMDLLWCLGHNTKHYSFLSCNT